MEKKLTYREYQKEDAPFLEAIIRKTWNYDSICPPKVAKQMAGLYLASCLTEQTYTRVALLDGIPVGIIMAKDIAAHKRSFRLKLNQIRKICPIYFSREGRKTAGIFSGIDKIDQVLLANAQTSYDGEIAFFAISEQCRGLGIGKELYAKALNYFKDRQIKHYYLYTDSTCNYGFYEHQGMIRRQETSYQVSEDKTMDFYLYEGVCGRKYAREEAEKA